MERLLTRFKEGILEDLAKRPHGGAPAAGWPKEKYQVCEILHLSISLYGILFSSKIVSVVFLITGIKPNY